MGTPKSDCFIFDILDKIQEIQIKSMQRFYVRFGPSGGCSVKTRVDEISFLVQKILKLELIVSILPSNNTVKSDSEVIIK